MRRALAILFVFGVLLSACGKEDEVALPTTTPFVAPSPTDSASPEPTASSEPSATPDATSTPADDDDDPPPAASERCRNSTDESCGEFRWDPDPDDNEAMTLKVTYTPKAPKAGSIVTFTVEAVDDGGTPERRSVVFGDGDTFVNQEKCEKQERPYGPWTPPEPDKQDNTDSFQHTYTRSGNFEVLIRYSTKRCDYYGLNPYGSEGRTSVKVDVAPNITPRPTQPSSPSPTPTST